MKVQVTFTVDVDCPARFKDPVLNKIVEKAVEDVVQDILMDAGSPQPYNLPDAKFNILLDSQVQAKVIE